MNADEDTTAPSNSKSAKRPWYRLSWIEYAVITGLFLLIGHLLLGSYAGYRHRHTCVICRLERVDVNWKYWETTSTYNETACSKWYPSHVEPTHQHVWSPNSATVLLNFYGQTIGVGDNDDRPGRAIWRLTPDGQIDVYKHFANPLNAKELFLSFMDPTVMESRHDIGIVYSLREWMESGFVGSWQHADDDRDPAHG